jgi:hypothetical protein
VEETEALPDLDPDVVSEELPLRETDTVEEGKLDAVTEELSLPDTELLLDLDTDVVSEELPLTDTVTLFEPEEDVLWVNASEFVTLADLVELGDTDSDTDAEGVVDLDFVALRVRNTWARLWSCSRLPGAESSSS